MASDLYCLANIEMYFKEICEGLPFGIQIYRFASDERVALRVYDTRKQPTEYREMVVKESDLRYG